MLISFSLYRHIIWWFYFCFFEKPAYWWCSFYWFAYIEPGLHPQDKFYLILVLNFLMCFDCGCYHFVEIFCIYRNIDAKILVFSLLFWLYPYILQLCWTCRMSLKKISTLLIVKNILRISICSYKSVQSSNEIFCSFVFLCWEIFKLLI